MFLKHLATPIEPFRDPPAGRDTQFEELWSRIMILNLGSRTRGSRLAIFWGSKKRFSKNTFDLELRMFLGNINTKTQRQIPIEDKSVEVFSRERR